MATVFIGGLEYPPISQISLAPDLIERLAALATLAVRARSAVFRDGYQREISYIPVPEGPARLARQLATLARGRAILEGRDAVTAGDLEEIIEIGFDCIPPHRREVLETLTGEDSELTTTTIASAVNYPTTSAKRILEDLAAIRVVERLAAREAGTNVDRWRLSEEALSWHAVAKPEKSSYAVVDRNKDTYGYGDFSGSESEP